LKNPGMYKSVSAFAPIANPMNCPWGQKAFEGYFGEEEKEKRAEHDATELVKKWKGEPLDVLIDVVCPLFHSFYSFASSNVSPRAFCRGRRWLIGGNVGHGRQLLQARPTPPRELPESCRGKG